MYIYIYMIYIHTVYICGSIYIPIPQPNKTSIYMFIALSLSGFTGCRPNLPSMHRARMIACLGLM